MIDLHTLAIAFTDAVKTLLDEIRRMSVFTYLILFIIAVLLILVPAALK
jgi:hypothetical protein